MLGLPGSFRPLGDNSGKTACCEECRSRPATGTTKFSSGRIARTCKSCKTAMGAQSKSGNVHGGGKFLDAKPKKGSRGKRQ